LTFVSMRPSVRSQRFSVLIVLPPAHLESLPNGLV